MTIIHLVSWIATGEALHRIRVNARSAQYQLTAVFCTVVEFLYRIISFCFALKKGNHINPRFFSGRFLSDLALGRSIGLLESNLHWFFLAFALPMVLFFVFATPPFQVPDEAAHLFRAEQLSHGSIIGVRYDKRRSGGNIDAALLRLDTCFTSDGSGMRASLENAAKVKWEGRFESVSFPNTVVYGPIGYLPQAVVLRVCRARGVAPLLTRYLNFSIKQHT